jgi:hypothetical protein
MEAAKTKHTDLLMKAAECDVAVKTLSARIATAAAGELEALVRERLVAQETLRAAADASVTAMHELEAATSAYHVARATEATAERDAAFAALVGSVHAALEPFKPDAAAVAALESELATLDRAAGRQQKPALRGLGSALVAAVSAATFGESSRPVTVVRSMQFSQNPPAGIEAGEHYHEGRQLVLPVGTAEDLERAGHVVPAAPEVN